jgi:glutamyl-tRNA synthetase
MPETTPVRVRFAPSPTGHLHLGGARTALYNYLLARQIGGQFILRLEDTDQKRYVPGSEDELIKTLHWLGLQWDEGFDIGGPEGPYRQSERKAVYQDYAHKLIEMDKAFYCFCSQQELEAVRQRQQQNKEAVRYSGTCRSIPRDEAQERVARGERHVIRFKMPSEGSITVHDRLRGNITVENKNLDDYILVKSDGLALYHLAAMVDDHLMKITHVIRGAEWLSTFPLHMHIIRSFGWEEPEFIHLSVFLKPSGKGKMSKREAAEATQSGYSIFVDELNDLGYIPEGVVNWIALMGWSYDDHTEFFTMDDLIEKFSLDRCNPSPAAINFSKLDHFNGLHIRTLPASELAKRMLPFFAAEGYAPSLEILERIAPLVRERMVTLDDAPALAGFFFEEQVHPAPETLVGKKMTPQESADAARQAYQVLADLPEINTHTAEEPMRALAESLNLSPGQLFGILRAAVTGRAVSPPLFESMAIIGREKVLERIQQAAAVLDELPQS